jgi:hypothetical protein
MPSIADLVAAARLFTVSQLQAPAQRIWRIVIHGSDHPLAAAFAGWPMLQARQTSLQKKSGKV